MFSKCCLKKTIPIAQVQQKELEKYNRKVEKSIQPLAVKICRFVEDYFKSNFNSIETEFGIRYYNNFNSFEERISFTHFDQVKEHLEPLLVSKGLFLKSVCTNNGVRYLSVSVMNNPGKTCNV